MSGYEHGSGCVPLPISGMAGQTGPRGESCRLEIGAADLAYSQQANFTMDSHPEQSDTVSATVVLMTEFFMDYLRSLYKEFDGDFALLMTLGEIGQANMNRYVSRTIHSRKDLDDLANQSADALDMCGCSALSAAMASGVPRETARRKVHELEARGWVVRGEDGHWYATPLARQHFDHSNHPETIARLLATADAIRAELEKGASRKGSGSPAGGVPAKSRAAC